MFNLEQSDIINGDVESILIDGTARTIDRLTEEGRRPKILPVFVSCVDSFIGTDHDYVVAQLRQLAPDIHFFDLAMDPINRDTMPPLVRLHNAVTSLFEKTGTDRTANWLGSYLPLTEEHPLFLHLAEQGIASRHLLNCRTLVDLRQFGNSMVNIAVTVAAVPAVRKLKERFGTPYYNLADPSDAESMTKEALLAL